MVLRQYPYFEYHPQQSQYSLTNEPFNSWEIEGAIWALFYFVEEEYLVRFPDLADFIIAKNGSKVKVYPVEGLSEQMLETLCVSQVIPLAMSRQFELSLHASAVEVDGAAIAFMGESGIGKSTLATSFSEQKCSVLTDDCLQIDFRSDSQYVFSSHRLVSHWLRERKKFLQKKFSRADSNEVPKDDPEDRSLPLDRIYLLGNSSGEIGVEPISGPEALVLMARGSFTLDITEQEMLSNNFAQLTTLAKRHIFFRLDYPRDFEVLPAVRQRVIEHLTSES